MNDCPSCGASLRYDIESGMLLCDHCMNRFSPEEYDRDHALELRRGTDEAGAEEDEAISEENGAAEGTSSENRYHMTVYSCPNCGAQIMAADESAVEYCSFCGSFVMLESSRIEAELPDYIIPFRKTKEECKNIYRKKIRSNPFAPGELRDPEYLNRFSGFYIPYWVFDIGFSQHPIIKGYKEHREGDYDVKEKFELTGDLSANYGGLVYDASSIFDDNISERIAPFGTAKMIPFTPSYLFGFFADQSDVDSDVYEGDARKLATDEVISNLMSEQGIRKYTLEETTDASLQRLMGTRIRSTKSAMLPVWFLTWRKNDRIAYSVVNGETGKIYAEVPIDPKRFLLGSLLLAIPLFLLFNAFLVFTPSSAMMMTAAAAPIAMVMYMDQLRRIERRNEGAGNKGAAVKKGSAQDPMSLHGVGASGKKTAGTSSRGKGAKKSASGKSAGEKKPFESTLAFLKKTVRQGKNGPGDFLRAVFTIMVAVMTVVYILFGAGAGILMLVSSTDLDIQLILYLLLAPCWAALLYFTFGFSARLKRPAAVRLMPLLCLVLGLILPSLIRFWSPVADWWYYGGCICSLVSAVIALMFALADYNESVTREAPKFFTKAKEEKR